MSIFLYISISISAAACASASAFASASASSSASSVLDFSNPVSFDETLGRFQAFDLRRELGRSDRPPAPLDDYPPDPLLYSEIFYDYETAREEVLHATRLLQAGEREQALTSARIALALAPDLASVMSGVNDVIRPRADVDAVAAELEAMYAALTEQGARVITCTFPLPATGLTRRFAPHAAWWQFAIWLRQLLRVLVSGGLGAAARAGATSAATERRAVSAAK